MLIRLIAMEKPVYIDHHYLSLLNGGSICLNIRPKRGQKIIADAQLGQGITDHVLYT
jgi:hypothetical protein